MRAFYLISAMGFILLGGCDATTDVNGSFEESSVSGRLLEGSAARDAFPQLRYFRFHLKQFGDEVGGIFESFDTTSYSIFSRIPVSMGVAMRAYYCGRIDYGYVRGDNVQILFTDREQRRWMYYGDLSDSQISGALVRVDVSGNEFVTDDAYAYAMPQDAAYLSNGGAPESEMVLQRMEDAEHSLDCIYQIAKTEVEVVIPESLRAHCRGICSNLKLAVIGSFPMSAQEAEAATPPALYEVVSLTVTQPDMTNDSVRKMVLRDDVQVISGSIDSNFIATLWLYDDLDDSGSWSSEEPIYATLKDVILIFGKRSVETSLGRRYYTGILPEWAVAEAGKSYQIFSDSVRHHWDALHVRSIGLPNTWGTLPIIDDKVMSRVNLHPIEQETGEDYCYFNTRAQSEKFPACTSMVPVLLYDYYVSE